MGLELWLPYLFLLLSLVVFEAWLCPLVQP